MALKSASDGTERKRIEWLPENKLLCLRHRSRSLEPTPTQLASLPPAPPLIERVYNTAGCWWALNGPASVLPVLACKPSSQAQGLASGAGSLGRCSRSYIRACVSLSSPQTEWRASRLASFDAAHTAHVPTHKHRCSHGRRRQCLQHVGPSVGDGPGSHGRLRGESVVVFEIVLVVSSSSRVATLLVSGVRRSVYSSS